MVSSGADDEVPRAWRIQFGEDLILLLVLACTLTYGRDKFTIDTRFTNACFPLSHLLSHRFQQPGVARQDVIFLFNIP